MTTTLMKMLQVVGCCLFLGFASAFQSHHETGQRKKPTSGGGGDDRCALIFLHGMGDTARGWSSLDHMLPSICPHLSSVEYIFPQAPIKGITLNGGELKPAWFDLFDWPVDSTSRDDVYGQLNSVCKLEDIVKKVEEEKGIPASRIVVGGFAQGGAIAMLASYYRKERKE